MSIGKKVNFSQPIVINYYCKLTIITQFSRVKIIRFLPIKFSLKVNYKKASFH